MPLAVVASQVSGLPSVFVRKAAKTCGTCRLAEGGEVAGHRIAVIEGVVASGGQVIASCRDVRDRGADIAAVLCVIDREAGGRENLAAEGLDLRALFTMRQLQESRATDPLAREHAPSQARLDLGSVSVGVDAVQRVRGDAGDEHRSESGGERHCTDQCDAADEGGDHGLGDVLGADRVSEADSS